MSRSIRTRILVLLCAVLLTCAVGCERKSAWDKALGERARWTVLALDWTQARDNTVLLSTRLSGPPNSPLATLTVKIVLQDAAGTVLREFWQVYDLTDVPRGGPKDVTVRIAADGPVDALGVDALLRPDPGDREHIPELAGLTP